MERKTQEKLIKYLKSKGAYVIKTKPGVGTPTGCPDVIALYEGFWAAFEVKRGKDAPYEPLQLETIQKLSTWSFARVVYPENLQDVIAELEEIM